jgi:nanoRNase/pAp phosphatase (c-di-AMP/oligoRNAs hydrolase)
MVPSSDNGSAAEAQLDRPSERLLKGLADFRSVILISHINPDPDSLGSMLGMAHLIGKKLRLPVLLTRDGYIGRAENRVMVEALRLELVPLEDMDWPPDAAVVMLDSQPNTGRHSLPAGVSIQAVIDHHETAGAVENIPFVDVRSDLGATCTLVAGYLVEQELSLPPRVATALYYGIESEITGYPREASPLDDSALLYLYPHVQKDLLAQIRNARLPQSYFEALLQALQNSFLYEDKLIISWAGELPQPELAAEVADLLLRHDGVEWSCCAGVYQDQMILSLRTIHARGQAGALLQEVVGRMGRAGGHDRRAGGCIPLASTASSAVEQVRMQLRRRLLQALEIDECRGQRLVRRRELLQSLQA